MIKSELINSKIFDKKGERDFIDFDRDINNNIIKNNIIIHGENLCTLELFKKEFKNKVKVVYIDPPYNTGGSNFTYKNRFDHKEWIYFMKKRLLMAKDFIKDNGFIVIAIDHYELFYLGVLADEIFGRENRIGIVSVVHNLGGRSQSKFFSPNNEFMIAYAKDKTIAKFRDITINEKVKKTFKYKDDVGYYRYEYFINPRTRWLRKNKPNNWYPIYVSKDLSHITHKKNDEYTELYPVLIDGREMSWKIIRESFIQLNKDNYFLAKYDKGEIKLYYKYREKEVFKTNWDEKKYSNPQHGTLLLEKIIGRKSVSFPKSLYTVLDTLKIMTDKNDIILDFFAGSGTTAHATLELNKEDGGNRQFIIIEQLKEHIDICKERIYKVIKNNDLDTSFVFFKKK